MERSGPVHMLGAKLAEIRAGLRSVEKRLDQRSPTVVEAKVTQKVGGGKSGNKYELCYDHFSYDFLSDITLSLFSECGMN